MIPKNLDDLSEIEVARLLQPLEHFERAVIRLRFGIPNGESFTMKNIAKMLEVPVEHIRQTELNAMVKLGWIRLVA